MDEKRGPLQNGVEELGDEYKVEMFSPSMKLAGIKEPFYTDLATVICKLQSPEEKKNLQQNAWYNGLFEKCVDHRYQSEAHNL